MSTQLILLQSADAEVYAEMLSISGAINRAYAARHGFDYIHYLGIERGYFPWHACFNRIIILNRMISEGRSGWVFYLDADAYVYGQEHDVRDLIATTDKPMIFGPGSNSGLPWDINDGVFLMNLDSPPVRELIGLWHDNFMSVSDDALRVAPNWEDVPSDQPRLQLILHDRPDLAEAIHRAERRFFNDYRAAFVRQALRGHGFSIEERIAMIRRDFPLAEEAGA